MADDKVMKAAASLPPVSKEKEKVSPPLPVVPVPAPVDDKVVKQMAVLVDVDVKPASSLPISPPLAAVMPADNSKNKTTTTTTTTTSTTITTTTPTRPVAVPILFMVGLWALVNAVLFGVADVVTLFVNRTPCTKSCVTLTDAASTELGLMLYGELLCSVAAAVAALPQLLTTRTTATTVGALLLAWVALAATAGIHCLELASDRIFLAADPGDTSIFVDVVFSSICLAVDLLLAGVLLCLCCCSPRRRLELGNQQGHDDGEV